MGTVEATSSTEVKPEKARRDRLNLTNGVFAVVLMLVAGLAGFYWMKLIEAISEGTTAGGSVTNGFFSVEMIVLVFLFTNVVGTVVFVTYFPPFRLYLYGTGNFTTAKRVFFLDDFSIGCCPPRSIHLLYRFFFEYRKASSCRIH